MFELPQGQLYLLHWRMSNTVGGYDVMAPNTHLENLLAFRILCDPVVHIIIMPICETLICLLGLAFFSQMWPDTISPLANV